MCDVNSSDVFHRQIDIIEYIASNCTIRGDFEKVTLPIWFILGVPGALLSLIIWTRPTLRQSSGIYLSAIALADLCFFLIHIPWYLDSAWKMSTLKQPVICEIFAFVNYFFQYMAPILTLGFTVERYIAICHPFIREKLCTTSRAYRVILGMTVICFILSTPHAYFFQYQTTIGDTAGVCKARPEFEDPNTWQHYLIYYWFVITEVIIFGIIPIVVLIVNSLVIRAIRRVHRQPFSNKFIERFKRQKRREFNGIAAGLYQDSPTQSGAVAATTWMLLCVSFYHIFSILPVSMCQILLFLIPYGSTCIDHEGVSKDPLWQQHLLFLNVRAVIESLAFTHYVTKFYICLACGKIFRSEFIRVVTCQRNKREDPRFAKRLIKRPLDGQIIRT